MTTEPKPCLPECMPMPSVRMHAPGCPNAKVPKVWDECAKGWHEWSYGKCLRCGKDILHYLSPEQARNKIRQMQGSEEPVIYPAPDMTRVFSESFDAVMAENAALRAEVERLKAENERLRRTNCTCLTARQKGEKG